jgi:hypothetical protein
MFMRERTSERRGLDRSTLDYVVRKLGRAPNCSMLSRMRRFERDMDRWLKRVDEDKD